MGKIRKPIVFSTYFGIQSVDLNRLNVFNPVLNVDTKLFIDPQLIRSSKSASFAQNASKYFSQYFEMIIKLLKASKSRGDVAWRQAAARLGFKEIKWTCLGYGASSIRGRKSSRALATRLTQTAKEIVDLGIEDPDLFSLLPLLEDGVGPDLISDLTTMAILPSLATFTEEICKELGITTTLFTIDDDKYQLPVNSTEIRKAPVLLVPKDILRSLPLASDWSEVADAAAANAAIRRRVNRLIGDIWEAKTRKEKAKLRANVLANKESFETLLEMLKTSNTNSYDLTNDPEGLLVWRTVYERIAKDYPLHLDLKGRPTFQSAVSIIEAIIDQFRILIENKGLWKLLCGVAPV